MNGATIVIIFFFTSFELHAQNLDFFKKFDPPQKDSSVNEQSGTHIMTRYSKTVGNLLFFRGISSANPHVFDIFRTDGTDEGTFPVTSSLLVDVNGNVLLSKSNTWASLNGVLFFVVTNRYPYTRNASLWRTDGTKDGTYEVEFLGEPASAYVLNVPLSSSSTNLFFILYNPVTMKRSLCSIDIAGVFHKCGDLSNASGFPKTSIINNKLILIFPTLSPTDTQKKLGIFISDGTYGSLTLMKELFEPGSEFVIEGITNINDDYILGSMYKTSKNDNIYYLVKLVPPLLVVDTFYRLGSRGNEGLYKTPNFIYPNEYVQQSNGNRYFFRGQTILGKWGLWSTDGSSEGTYLIKEQNSSWNAVSVAPFRYLFPANGKYIFSEDTTYGNSRSLFFSTDGLPLSYDTIQMPLGIIGNPLSSQTNIDLIYTHQNAAYLSVSGSIWKSDGTAENTIEIFRPPALTGWQINYSHLFDIAGDYIYFPLVEFPQSVINKRFGYAKLNTKATGWTGNKSTNFMDPENWDNGTIPTENTNVLIPSGRKYYPVINQNLILHNLTLNKGSSFSVSNGSSIQIK